MEPKASEEQSPLFRAPDTGLVPKPFKKTDLTPSNGASAPTPQAPVPASFVQPQNVYQQAIDHTTAPAPRVQIPYGMPLGMLLMFQQQATRQQADAATGFHMGGMAMQGLIPRGAPTPTTSLQAGLDCPPQLALQWPLLQSGSIPLGQDHQGLANLQAATEILLTAKNTPAYPNDAPSNPNAQPQSLPPPSTSSTPSLVYTPSSTSPTTRVRSARSLLASSNSTVGQLAAAAAGVAVSQTEHNPPEQTSQEQKPGQNSAAPMLTRPNTSASPVKPPSTSVPLSDAVDTAPLATQTSIPICFPVGQGAQGLPVEKLPASQHFPVNPVNPMIFNPNLMGNPVPNQYLQAQMQAMQPNSLLFQQPLLDNALSVARRVRDNPKLKICRMERCMAFAAKRTPYCPAHAGPRRCETPGCNKCAQGRTRYCIGHGGGRRCTAPGCTKGARDKFFCAGHGGGKRCEVKGCSKSAVGGCSKCTSHGGGRRCQSEGCSKSAQSCTPFCVRHGGGKKCIMPDCEKVARGRTSMCMSHNVLRAKVEAGKVEDTAIVTTMLRAIDQAAVAAAQAKP
mmetsp:Transcript_26341/g.52542  ORF Transcript_26341/g.52542 Transcript_26341/m.52542 type:complete len:563 (+) Transcript_26341:323-2011(+)|eukprot:CAMPEP_0182462304 /NCGR_PEP_ID=MMETSP1319-20130603/6620_1 /TAXON_ID=172717 /ORGANISM="Bolidomonas pacifica, Strain RCC208" /LENGTH=562 /DNA_ID=CAMNT_0024661725 /DNA_START=322 /DNA_END=2010 /DNA_ORIENTATION=+